jgi:hypothetical protein
MLIRLGGAAMHSLVKRDAMAKKKKSDRLRPSSSNILDYPSTWSPYERESLAAEAELAEQRQIQKLEELFKHSKVALPKRARLGG